MSCDCAQCRQHHKTLGFMFGIPSESEIEEGYHEGVKQWHPDLYENYASLRADAEEHFKAIQVAYRELKEHNTVTAGAPAKSVVVQSSWVASEPRKDTSPISKDTSPVSKDTSPISFGDAPGCLTEKQFTSEVKEMIAPHLGKLGLSLAIVDLSGKRSITGGFSHFFLLASRGMMMRDHRNIISVLWYTDLGEIKLVDQRKSGKPSGWQKFIGGLSGGGAGYMLQIDRSNGANFYTMSGEVDDGVKSAIYNFLVSQKPQTRP